PSRALSSFSVLTLGLPTVHLLSATAPRPLLSVSRIGRDAARHVSTVLGPHRAVRDRSGRRSGADERVHLAALRPSGARALVLGLLSAGLVLQVQQTTHHQHRRHYRERDQRVRPSDSPLPHLRPLPSIVTPLGITSGTLW